MTKTLDEMPATVLSEEILAEFARELPKYPEGRQQSAVIACLSIIQREKGWVSPEDEKAVAEYLDLPPIVATEITTFYDMFSRQPMGRFKLAVCTNLPCQLRGGLQALKYLEDKLGVRDGETTEDNEFSIEHCECLGACADAPVMLVNDRDMCSFMSHDKLEQLIEGLRAAEDGR